MNFAWGLSCVRLIHIGGDLTLSFNSANIQHVVIFVQPILNVEVAMGAKFAACSMSCLTSMSKIC